MIEENSILYFMIFIDHVFFIILIKFIMVTIIFTLLNLEVIKVQRELAADVRVGGRN